MVFILNGNQEIDNMYLRTNLCYLIYLRHLTRSRAVTNYIFFQNSPIFFNACATCSELPSNMIYYDVDVDI